MENLNKAYTEFEQNFLKTCIKLREEKRLSNSAIAEAVSPIMGRSKTGIAVKLSELKSSLELPPEPVKKPVIKIKPNPASDNPFAELDKEFNLSFEDENLNNEKKMVSPVDDFKSEPKGNKGNRLRNSQENTMVQKKKPKPDTLTVGYQPFPLSDVGERVEVEVYNIMPYGAFCKTDDNRTGLLIKGLMSTEHVEQVEDFLQLGDRFEVLIVEDRRTPGKVLLNAKAIGNIIPIHKR